MSFIQWNDDLSVKVAEFDQQHMKLIEMINDLHGAMKEGRGRAVVGEIVEKLIAYTDLHFTAEEKQFDALGYPMTAEHKAEHAAFVKKVVDFSNDLAAGKITLSIELMNFLSTWLKGHIKGTDKKYSEFFNEKGIS